MLTGKVVVVTGGSRGIGAAVVRKLASLGAKIAVVDLAETETSRDLLTECENEYRTEIHFYACDVSDFDAVKGLVSRVKEDFGTVDILVNNAGINRDRLLAMMKESDFDSVIDTNLKGVFNMVRHCTQLFIRNRGGRIINISSVAGLVGNPGQVNYSASKAGVVGLTKAVAKELAGKQITCNAIAPGFIQTDMTKDFDASNPLVAAIPMQRMGEPNDVAELVAFLASPTANYITGEVIRVDGGLAM